MRDRLRRFLEPWPPRGCCSRLAIGHEQRGRAIRVYAPSKLYATLDKQHAAAYREAVETFASGTRQRSPPHRLLWIDQRHRDMGCASFSSSTRGRPRPPHATGGNSEGSFDSCPRRDANKPVSARPRPYLGSRCSTRPVLRGDALVRRLSFGSTDRLQSDPRSPTPS